MKNKKGLKFEQFMPPEGKFGKYPSSLQAAAIKMRGYAFPMRSYTFGVGAKNFSPLHVQNERRRYGNMPAVFYV
jgi:hypothetical protein